MSNQIAVLLLLLLSPLAVSGLPSIATAQQPDTATVPLVSLPGTRLHVLHSATNGQTYLLKISLPIGYEGAPARPDTSRYPTLYLVEPLGLFPLFHSLKSSPLVSPGVLLVAIESADQSPAGQMKRATLDYTPRDDSSAWAKRASQDGVRFGGADAFLRVLKEEIIPLVDRTYRTSADRGIHGHSFGGLFVAYTLLEAPDLFTRYAITSPSLWWNDKMIITREPAFAKQHPVFPKHVFLSIGSDEGSVMAAVMYQFAARLCNSFSDGYYKGLDLIVESIAGEEHPSPVPHWSAMKALYPADTSGPKRRGELRWCGP